MKYLVVQAFWYFDKVTGEFHYRIQSPGDALAQNPAFQVKNIHIFHPLFPQLALDADLLILHLLPDAEVWRILQLRKQAGKPTIYEIADNFLNPGPWVSVNDAYRNPLVRQHFLGYARLADACSFSTAEVAQVFAEVNPRRVVFENQASHFSSVSPELPPLKLGWGGSVGHREDLLRIAPVIRAFLAKHPEVSFTYMGHPPIYEEVFEGLGDQGRCIPSGPIEAYYQFLEEIHVGIAPLADTAFNRCRSDVKFLEYAAHHVVPLLEDVAPYRVHARHGENALLFGSVEQLAELLEELVQNPERVRRLADQAFAYAQAHRDRDGHTEVRSQFYQELIGSEPQSNELPDLPETAGLIGYMRKVTFHYDQAEYEAAFETLEKVLQLYPTYSLAQVFLAKVLVHLGEHATVLEHAWSVHPIYSDLLRECQILAAQAAGYAQWPVLLQQIENPVLRLKHDPSFETDPKGRARAILAQDPYDYPSLKLLASDFTLDPETRADYRARRRFIEGSDALP